MKDEYKFLIGFIIGSVLAYFLYNNWAWMREPNSLNIVAAFFFGLVLIYLLFFKKKK